MKNTDQISKIYDNPWVVLELMKNLNKSGFNAVFSFEEGTLKLIIQKKAIVMNHPLIH